MPSSPRDDDNDEEIVIVELDVGSSPPVQGDRSQRIARKKAHFEELAQPVEAMIAELGGTTEDRGWLNGTLRCRLSRSAIEQLRADERVLDVSPPRGLDPDAG